MTIDKPKYFIIGHITEDIITVEGDADDPQQNLGGSVSYGATTADELGYEAHIITKCDPNHPYLQELERRGIIVHNLPARDAAKSGSITSFINTYNKNGHRTQTVDCIQEAITIEDLEEINNIISEGSIIHIAPVINEVDPQLFPSLAKVGFLAITPQGYFRERLTGGTVLKKNWKNITALAHTNLVILSTQDLMFSGLFSRSTLTQLTGNASIFILTKQEKGSIIYRRGKEVSIIKAFKLKAEEEKNFTGAGDTFAAAFIIHYQQFKDLHQAGVFASFYAALKIFGLENEKRGISTIPRLNTVKQFINQYPDRISSFLKQNRSSCDADSVFSLSEVFNYFFHFHES